MKKLFELYHISAPISRYLLHFLIVFSLTAIAVSFFCFNFAEHSMAYYDLRNLSLDLIIILRSAFFIISFGIAAVEMIERKHD